ncbi:aldehyde dehydrogenase family protein [Jiangella mangrovi]|uniref:Acyl-CoA reductase-like NAD-dependent aldehyde dehydrogenase n=1 Tax=Jiangella mangrovi TaxID=1524084 RepID=A0A7W9LQ31_9ACTN|nr:acyl-CoA reductase-like NAD-dependent aldehyde dehydrogenase [Jiangella mangrovi]
MAKQASRPTAPTRETSGSIVLDISELPAQAVHQQLYVAGGFEPAADGRTFPTVNPATGEPIADIALAGPEDVDRAVAAARGAFDRWAGLDPRERGRLLRRIAETMIDNLELLAQVECLDLGKPITDCRAGVRDSAAWFEYFADVTPHLRSSTIPHADAQLAYVLRRPRGVVAVIPAWNFPLPLYGIKIAAALGTGNAVVLKPAEQTPLSALLLATLCAEAGLPPGVLNVLTGPGAETGRLLVRHPGVDMITFTGSTEVGREIAAAAGERLTKVTLELGGKSPNIVFADADLESAAATGLFSFTVNQGQLCSAGTRLLVERPVHDELLALLTAKAEALRVGDPRDEASHLGAIVSDRQLSRVEGYVESGRQSGATVVTGGRRAEVPGLPGGYFYTPTIFTDVDPAARIANEEIFGPVLAVLPFDDEEEAVRLANAVDYGLAAGVWTRDLDRVHRVSSAVEAGIVWVNTMHQLSPAVPYTGWKQSGLGVEGGTEQALEFTRPKSVWVGSSAAAPRFV